MEWSKQEVDYLAENWTSKYPTQLSEELWQMGFPRRSPQSIHGKARRLGLDKLNAAQNLEQAAKFVKIQRGYKTALPPEKWDDAENFLKWFSFITKRPNQAGEKADVWGFISEYRRLRLS